MKKKLLIYLMVFSFLFSLIPMQQGTGGSQVWENKYNKLEVYPITSTGLIRQKQYYNAQWYYPGNTLDIAFCFNESLSYGGVYYWNGSNYNKVNHNHVEYNGKHYYVLSNIFFNQMETKHGYWEYDIPVGSSGKWDMYLKLSGDTWEYAFQQNRYIHLDPWWHSNWTYKKSITIDHNQVPSDLSNFPVCINLSSDSNLVAHVGYSDGRDIAFSNGVETTQLNHELVYFNSGTGQLISWVNVTSLSSSVNTTIFMYYGNNDTVNQSNPTGVWDSDYIAVYHMDGSDYTGITDSTINYLNASSDSGSPTYYQNAVIDKGVSFDGTDDYIIIPDNDAFTFSSGTSDLPFTIESVFKKLDSNFNVIISKYYGTLREWIFYVLDTDILRILTCFYPIPDGYSLYEHSSDTLTNTNYHYGVATFTGGDPTNLDNVHIYLDGSNNTDGGYIDPSYDYMINSDAEVRIGYYSGDSFFKGIIDEIRISKDGSRSADWITTTYNSIFNATNSSFFTLGDEVPYSVDVQPPTNLIAVTDGDGNIDLSWDIGVNSTHSMIEWNTVSIWGRGSGTLLYNDTGNITSLTTTSCNVLYYFQGWGYNSTSSNWSINFASSNNISCPGDPSGVSTRVYGSALNITWTNNTYATSTLVIRKTGSYPTSVTDGTTLYNGTNKYYNDTSSSQSYYYQLYSYNNTVNRYSDGVNAPQGSLIINVYDENTSSAISNWDVFISNQQGTQTYESLGNNNPLTVDVTELPYGENTLVKINATGYNFQIYYMDIEVNTHYTLDAYLSLKNATEQYFITVVGPQLEYGYEPPVDDATINFKRYINDTEGYQNISTLVTSGSGTVSIKLVPKENYLLIISKTGYNTEYVVFIPPPIVYAEDRYHTFRLTTEAEEPGPSYDIFWDNITFTGVMTSPGYPHLGNITITYFDRNSSTVDTQIYLYESYNGTVTLLSTDSRSSNNDFSYTVSNINTTRLHYMVLYFNNTASFYVSSPVTITIYAIYVYTEVTPFDIDDRITPIVGPPPIGTWRDIISIILPLVILVSLGPFNTGVALLGCGMSIGITQGFFAMYGMGFNVLLASLCPLIIVIGVLYIWTKGQGVDHL